jgi:hypothetical protein
MKRYPNSTAFDYFKKRCIHWSNTFCLNGWYGDYHLGDVDDGFAADCYANWEQKIFSITLSKKYTHLPKKELNRLALHETIHILCSGIMFMAVQREYNDKDVRAEEHLIVRILEKVLLK